MSEDKNLIVDTIKFEPDKKTLQEAKQSEGPFMVQGILQKADEKNQNGRIYPRKVLEKEVERYRENFIKENRALGELDHPESSVVNLKNVSHNIEEVWWENNVLKGKVRVLTTPAGNILRELFTSGVTLGISSRGLGSIQERQDGTIEVQEDYSLLAWDMVSEPSTNGAFVSPKEAINESVDPEKRKQNEKYQKVNRIITDIFQYAGEEPDLDVFE